MNSDFDRLLPLSVDDLKNIHEKTVEVLTETGMYFELEEARDVFKRHGFKVEGDIVYYTEKAIEEALKTVPSGFTVLARNPNHNMYIKEGSFHFAPGGGSPFVTDSNGVRRNATPKDYDNFQKLIQTFDAIECTRPIVIPSAEIPAENAYMYTTYSALKHMDKVPSIYEDGMKMVCIAYGITEDTVKKHATEGKYYGLSVISVTSPLELTERQCRRLLNQAGNYGTPLVVAPMPAAGATAPCTLPGMLIQQNCENIGVIVLSQLVNPGNPVFYGCMGSGVDMRTGSAVYGAPEARVIEYASAQIARFYGIPSRGNGGMTDSHSVDFTAGAESMMHYYNVVRCGINLIPGAGHMGSFLEQSFEKFILDCEIMGFIKRVIKPLEFTEEKMAVDVIKKVGAKGQYLTEEHTFKHFKDEFYNPFIFTRSSYDVWKIEGKKEAKDRAREKYLSILENYQKPPIDPSIEKDLDKYVEKHWPVRWDSKATCE